MDEFVVRVRCEGGVFWAEVDELPGCYAAGNDVPELFDALTEAICLYLAPRRVR